MEGSSSRKHPDGEYAGKENTHADLESLDRSRRSFISRTSTCTATAERIDEEIAGQIKASLESINPFRKLGRISTQRKNSDEFITILELTAGGVSSYRHLSVWELYEELLEEIKAIDPSNASSNETESQGPSRYHSSAVNFRVRDLRWLEASFADQEPTILVRKHLIIILLEPIRALVMAKKLLLIVPAGADSLLGILEKHMNEWTPEVATADGCHAKIPFELHAYEALLMSVKVTRSKHLERIVVATDDVLRSIKEGTLLSLQLQEEMRGLKNTASQMALKINLYRRALNDIIMNDEEMALMSLTKLSQNPALYRTPLCTEILHEHEEVEQLLQTFVMDFNSQAAKLEYVRSEIQNAEDLVSLRLDTSRNELLIANTFFAMGACVAAFGGYIAGIFGMNLDNTASIMPVEGVFAAVFCGSFFLMVVFFILISWYMKVSGMLPKRTTVRPKKSQVFYPFNID